MLREKRQLTLSCGVSDCVCRWIWWLCRAVLLSAWVGPSVSFDPSPPLALNFKSWGKNLMMLIKGSVQQLSYTVFTFTAKTKPRQRAINFFSTRRQATWYHSSYPAHCIIFVLSSLSRYVQGRQTVDTDGNFVSCPPYCVLQRLQIHVYCEQPTVTATILLLKCKS